jgi:hypothetical protein
MGDEITNFINAYTAKVQREIEDLTAEVVYTTAVHEARASVAGLASDVRQQVEDDVAEILGIE